MNLFTIPNVGLELEEFNWCHNPEGAKGGQFCATGERVSLGNYPYEKHSVRIPDYLKADVLAARRAGINVVHVQQPEPVKDVAGEIHDPLALSHAKGSYDTWWDTKGFKHVSATGRILLSTRGGEWVPTVDVWGSYGPIGKKDKPTTPDTPFEKASILDIVSTFRHEVGHLMDKKFRGNKSGTVSDVMGREVRAWTHAVEMSPDHIVSERMMRNGLNSHGYYEFRKQVLRKDPLWRRVASWELDERLDRVIKNETEIDPASMAKAKAFTERVIGALKRYGAVLRKKGMVRVPSKEPTRWYGQDKIRPGPGIGSGRFL